MSSAKITLYGFYNWYSQIGEDFFSNLTLPDGLDKNTLIMTILDRGGEFETIYSDPNMLMAKMEAWSTAWNHTISRWVETMTTDYAPLENYDRQEAWTDSGKASASDNSYSNMNASITNDTSAFDSSSYQPEDRANNSTQTSGNSATNSNTSSEHAGRVHGNIGVTTSAQMATGEMELRLLWGNLYKHIADCFLREFVIPIYV